MDVYIVVDTWLTTKREVAQRIVAVFESKERAEAVAHNKPTLPVRFSQVVKQRLQ